MTDSTKSESVTLTVGKRAVTMRLCVWSGGSSLVAIAGENDGKPAVSQKSQVIGYHDGTIIRREQRVWTD